MATTEEELTTVGTKQNPVDDVALDGRVEEKHEESSYAVFIPNTDEGAQLLKPRSQTTARS